MNGQKTEKTLSADETQKKADAIRARQKKEGDGAKGAESPTGTTGKNEGGNGGEAKQRRRKSRAEEDARAVEASKVNARKKIAAEIEALEKLKALV